MNLSSLLRHLYTTRWKVGRQFPAASLTAIEQTIHSGEANHSGEIRFAIESSLEPAALWRGLTPRARAHQVFAQLGVWDTELNNGVLIYVLCADRDVEIVADRGFDKLVEPSEWAAACHAMEREFRVGQFERGAVAGVNAVNTLISRHFPMSPDDINELPDRPVIL